MPPEKSTLDPTTFKTFGALLRYLRRGEQLTQRDLGIAVGYSEGHINRFEKDRRLPDPADVAALFIPALHLSHSSALAARLIELAGPPANQPPGAPARAMSPESGFTPEAIPPALPNEILRAAKDGELRLALQRDRCVQLCGLPGMGKTTLASRLAREYAARMPVFWLTLTEGITTSAEGLLRQIGVFLAANGCEEVRPVFAVDPSGRINLPMDLKVSLVCAALTRQPALLCFDNAEWLQRDAACFQILRHIAATTPAYLLLSSRESLALPAISEVNLNGLAAEEGLAFIAQNAGLSIAASQAARLIEKTDGNPMLLRLAVGKILSDKTSLDPLIDHLASHPQVIAYLLETIQKQLSPGGWRLLLLLAVFQKPVDLYDAGLVELARELGDISPVSAAIQELQRRQLIVNAAYARLHPLVGDFVRQALNADGVLRQRLHRLAAEWYLDNGLDPLSAAFHFLSAGLLEEAVDAIEENESTILARGEALSAVALLDDVQARLKRLRANRDELLRRLLVQRAVLLNGTLRVAEGEADLRQAIELTSSPSLRAYTLYRLAEVRMSRSSFNDALQLVKEAREILAPNDLLLKARLLSIECIALNATAQPDAAYQAALDTLAVADQMTGIPAVLADNVRVRAWMELGNTARIRRDLQRSMECARQALIYSRSARNQRSISLSLLFIGGLIYDEGDLDASFAYRSEALEGLIKIGDVHSAAYVLTQLADIHYLRLETGQAIQRLEQALQTLEVVGDFRAIAAAESNRSTCLLCQGDIEEARRVIERLLQSAAVKSGAERLWGYRLKRLAAVQLVQGQVQAAIATLHNALDLPAIPSTPMQRFELHTILAFAYAVAGEHARAADCLAGAPAIDGLSRWAELDRALAEAYAALACGDLSAAQEIYERNSPRAEPYPLFRRNFQDLRQAILHNLPPARFPRLLWVSCCPQETNLT